MEEVAKALVENLRNMRIIEESFPQIKIVGLFLLGLCFGLYLGDKFGCWRTLKKCQKSINRWWKGGRD